MEEYTNSLTVSLFEKVKEFYGRCLPEKSHVSLMERASDKSFLGDRNGEKKSFPMTIF